MLLGPGCCHHQSIWRSGWRLDRVPQALARHGVGSACVAKRAKKSLDGGTYGGSGGGPGGKSAGAGSRRKGVAPSAGDGGLPLADTRHPSAKRKNNPPAALAAEGTVRVMPKVEYAYNPHLPPVLRFDQHGGREGGPDALPELIAAAGKRPLTADEQRLLAEHLRKHEPWLEWTGKRERPSFAVDPVALHIHERISAQAILKVAARQDVNKSLFADPEHEYHEAVQFYKHDIDWSNRLILGDSLQVMSSLARREDLAGKVQMIYMDPPYGIKFASNFQPEVGKRDVKDKQEDLTREPEMVRAYRDTWHLGIHSYLSYLRDRLVVAKELLADTGSIFMQISDENLHRVRDVLDEVFGADNAVSVITIRKTTSEGRNYLGATADYLIWYARDITRTKYRTVYLRRSDESDSRYDQALDADGQVRTVQDAESEAARVGEWPLVFRMDNITSSRPSGEGDVKEYVLHGRLCDPGSGTFKSNVAGLNRLASAERLQLSGAGKLNYRRGKADFGVSPVANLWVDISGAVQSRSDPKVYVVQTSTSVIERCMFLTTDPGDLVLDPTCGSGTTAYVAEEWGRRWITTDTSRVAVAIARQRLLTAKFETYKTKGTRPGSDGRSIPDPASGFHYKTVPHITLKSIAQNVALDPIFAKHEPQLEATLKQANAALQKVTEDMRRTVTERLAIKAARGRISDLTDADYRRHLLPGSTHDMVAEMFAKQFRVFERPAPTTKQIRAISDRIPKRAKVGPSSVPPNGIGWEHWQVPFDTWNEWPKPLQDAVTAYRAAWRAKMDEVNACIQASAEQEELVDQPEPVKGVTRVSGPFTVESVQPPEMTLGDVTDRSDDPEFAGSPEELEAFHGESEPVRGVPIVEPKTDLEVANVGTYLDQMFRFIKQDGVRFLNNKQMRWSRLEPLFESASAAAAMGFHAEGRWTEVGQSDSDEDGRANVAVTFGPQYGPVTGAVVVELIRNAHRRGYDHLVVAGFNFDGAAQAEADNRANLKVTVHLAHIRPDINPGMEGLLKETPKPGSGQLFTVFGQPRVTVRESKREEGLYEVEMEGVDVYDPARDEIRSTGAGKVAAWFLDGDYDGITFCVTQAFFPDRSAWEKLQKALNGKDGPIDAERFEAFSGTTSLPFPLGKHRCVAVKVIDPRGNEVMAVERMA